jgi:hypothetical protein
VPSDDQFPKLRHKSIVVAGGGQVETWISPQERMEFRTRVATSGGGGAGTIYWDRCGSDGCLGAALNPAGLCFVHATAEDRAQHIARAVATRKPLSLEGVELDEGLWSHVLTEVVAKKLHLNAVAAVFLFGVRLKELDFSGPVSLVGAEFRSGLQIRGCTFRSVLALSYADFMNNVVSIENSQVTRMTISHCEFRQHLAIVRCEFEESVDAQLMAGDFRIVDSTVGGRLDLSQSALRVLSLSGTRVRGDLIASNVESRLVQGGRLKADEALVGPIQFGICDLSRAEFGRRVQVELEGEGLDLTHASFAAGGLLSLTDIDANLERLILGAPTTVTGKGSASVTSLRGADAGDLTLSSLDLRRCSFYEALNLDSLKLESNVRLPEAPGWWRTRRKCIADEFSWRAGSSRRRSRDWVAGSGASVNGSAGSVVAASLTASQVSSLYRSLRKGLEAQKDEPGAADFYYGEMEMRRLDKAARRLERPIIFGYWLLSGYGLRGLRSFLGLLILVLVGWQLMWTWGIGPPSLTRGDALLASLQSLFPGIVVTPHLSASGRWFSLVLRIFGPILIGLTLLAIRGRIKR